MKNKLQLANQVRKFTEFLRRDYATCQRDYMLCVLLTYLYLLLGFCNLLQKVVEK